MDQVRHKHTHTHVCLFPPPCILNPTLKQSSINLVQFYTPVHLKTQCCLCVAVPRELNLGTMTTITTRLPPIPPPQRKGWPCIHAAVNSVSYLRAQRVTGLSPHPQNSQYLPPLTPIKSLATIVLLCPE